MESPGEAFHVETGSMLMVEILGIFATIPFTRPAGSTAGDGAESSDRRRQGGLGRPLPRHYLALTPGVIGGLHAEIGYRNPAKAAW